MQRQDHPMEPEQKNVRILLIEDDEDDYQILRDYLMEQDNRSAFQLDWVATYQAGLKDIERADHDVYLIDHYLGLNSGLDLLKEAVQAGCQAPLIIVTGQSDREIDQAALMAGAMDYLVKGKFDGQLLERSIRYALERSRLLKKIRELAVRDALTGLYNRRELYRFLDYEIIKSKRYSHAFSLLLMDIDHFKDINDRFGHRVGDEILQQVAQVLLSQTRGCDLPARYGGDEFIVVLPETPTPQGLIGAERLRKVVENVSIQIANESGNLEKLEVTMSIGLAGYPGDAETGEQIIDLADQALYQAKHIGCNQVVRYNADQIKEFGSK
jgi:two-component system cell cycle response regulator